MRIDKRSRIWAVGCGISLLAMGCGSAAPKAASTTVVTKDAPAVPLQDGAVPAYSDVPDAVDASSELDAQAIESAVSKVTVFSDRARVTRLANAKVTTEPTVFAFSHLPGWVDDGSVRVSASAGRIVDVRVERTFLARATDAKWRNAENHHKKLSAQLAELDDELAVLNAQKAQIESIKAFSLEKITKDTTIGNVSVTTYSDVLSFVSDSQDGQSAPTRSRPTGQNNSRVSSEHKAFG